nr:nucleotidyltransferase family protein [uncultured Fretibacterium sp.]
MIALLPAAGLSRRMGTQKLLLPFGAGTVLEAVIGNLRAAGLIPILCVLSEATLQGLRPLGEDVTVLINPAPERGYASSLAIALDALGRAEPAALREGPFCLMLGDLPTAQAHDMARLRLAFERRPAGYTALAPYREGRFGHPIFMEGLWRARLRAAAGDRGGRGILEAHEGEVLTMEGEDGFFDDLDTPEDYRRVCRPQL